MKYLPLGRQDFRKIRKENLLYVDKTEEIYKLISSPMKYIFFSRPRRFGKSMLISTLKYLFEGEKELFKGLYIEDKYDFDPLPVIHVDFSGDMKTDSPEDLKKSIQTFFIRQAEEHKLPIEQYPSFSLQYLAQDLFKKYQKPVVLLIDEYDKAITDHLTNIEIATQQRDILRGFFSGLKNADQYLRLVFITGVSRFGKVSIFSMLNNITEISLDPNYHNLVGFKPSDIELYFEEYLQKVIDKFGGTKEELMQVIQQLYNGYSWDGLQRVYNPFSLVNAFHFQELENYWFQSATPKFLVDMIQEKQVFVPHIEEFKASLDVKDSMDLSDLDLASLLFQTGYLTVEKVSRSGKYKQRKLYTLKYPNEEVKESMFNHLLANKAGLYVREIMPLHIEMLQCLETQEMDKFLKHLKALYAKIPARLHLEAEAYYHSLFYMMLHLLGAEMKLEQETSIGRIDAVLEIEDSIYIIECKYAEKGKIETLLDKAMQQIHEKKYYEAYLTSEKPVFLLALGFVGRTEIDLRMEKLDT